jgi:hypothetical protein
LTLLALAVLLLGCFPGWLLGWIENAIKAVGH